MTDDNHGIEGAPFEIEEQQLDGRRVLTLSGELDLASAPALVERVDRLLSAGVRAVTADLTHLDFMDSTGIQALLRCDSLADELGREFSIVSPATGEVARVIELTALEDLLQIFAARRHSSGRHGT